MKPVIIQSFLGNRNGNAVSYEETKILATCSLYYAKKNTKFKIILYTDKIGAKILKDVPYDEVILFDQEIIDQLPKRVWSAGKILAMSMEKRPFIHIDFDFFILNKKFFKKIKKSPFFAYHNEPWSADLGKKGCFYENGVKIILQILNESLNLNLRQKFISVNFSIFGSCIEHNVSVINESAKKMIDCIIKHKEFLDSEDLLEHLTKYFNRIDYVMIPLVIEQVLFLTMVKQKLKKYSTLIKIKHPRDSYKAGSKIGVFHLWDSKKEYNIIQKLDSLYNFITRSSNKNV